ncbi:formate dehydrogenase accessory protein [Campylobacter blaseri]|uniref:Sulfur carrier protein FdhD n=1 Tax=Campylobacter blaseri TaxID=2042961 RepID=A0A2P8R471_9BACT|nr:formate dehydrogenase accessory sulfurtransferase FdhD [Campylobacter blaseri]PSM53304.1 sulfurtransferase FdhD [Campylobacter blaseri]PSM54770.1 sulfurtransferase FdhD [Campylobacter blaseri]QKF86748.1 formate dehydrogenase accessory protein [Campylobacter blaseri]
MEPIFSTQITKIKGHDKFITDDILVKEIQLNIFVNGEKIGSIMSTPVDQKPLAIGYLMSEGIILNINDINKIELSDDEESVYIDAKANEDSIKKLTTEGVIISGCGKSMTANIDPNLISAKIIDNPVVFSRGLILSRMATFYTQCDLYEQTGCVHTAKLHVSDREFYIGEDIAQHSTIDKAVGKARMKDVDLSKSFLMVSGRLSSEMVAKVVMHQIPVLVSRTAPTHLGVEIARKFNLTLCGFARGNNMNIYSAAERIE